jgi:hypothetical protein
MKIGDTIEISGGPLSGLNGTLVGLFGRRLLVVIEDHAGHLEVEMEQDWVAPSVLRPLTFSVGSHSKRHIAN